MAILEQSTAEVKGGFKKEIDAGAMNMLIDTVQKQQYQFPIKSAVRELVSNALDSIKERDVALEILTGKAKVSDYYEEREGALYKDSKFDSTYYNSKYLSTDPTVTVEYHVGDNMEKDFVRIVDYGVGLGSYRLEKYFSIGWSTKRLSRSALGAFGIGNKSPLSIGDYYTIESRYNGRLFRFNVYDHDIESIIPKFDLKRGVENERHTFRTGTEYEYVFYSESTDEQNGLSVVIPAKKHHKAEYLEAVQSQLLYFKNILFTTFEAGDFEDTAIGTDILYEDDMIVLGSNNYFSKPHILVNKVNYGYVHWEELELNGYSGNIGIKVQPEEVGIATSREHLLWNEKTKNVILQRFKDVVTIAENFVQKELTTTDFWAWVKTCFDLTFSYRESSSSNAILSRLGNIVDLQKIKPKFRDTDIRFSSDLFKTEMLIRIVGLETVRKGGSYQTKVTRKLLVETMIDNYAKPVFYSAERANNRKDKYLLSLYPQGYLLVQPYNGADVPEDPLSEEFGTYVHKYVKSLTTHDTDSPEFAKLYNAIHKRFASREPGQLWDLMVASKDTTDYDALVVPENYSGDDTDVTEESEDGNSSFESAEAREARRKLEEKIVMQTPRVTKRCSFGGEWDNRDSDNFEYEYHKYEVPVADIDDWDNEEVYVGNEADRLLITLAANMTRETHGVKDHLRSSGRWSQQHKLNADDYRCTHFTDNPRIRLVKVSQQNSRYFKDFKHIQRFFQDIKNNTLTMSNMLIKWNTARFMYKRIQNLQFLANATFLPEQHAAYAKILQYVKDHYRSISQSLVDDSVEEQLLAHMDKVMDFQRKVASGNFDAEGIKKLATAEWGTDTIQDGHAVDLKLIEEFEALLAWAEPVGQVLNRVLLLTANNHTLTELEPLRLHEDLYFSEVLEEAERSFKEYLSLKNVKF
jgi:hypothetical protein